MIDQVPQRAIGTNIPAPLQWGDGPSYFFSGDDALLLTIVNSVAGVIVTFTGRFLNADDGRVAVVQQAFTPTSSRVASTIPIGFAVGWLLDWSVKVTTGSPTVGQVFAAVTLQRGMASSALELSTLSQGYITATQRLYGPNGPNRGLREGPGALRTIVGTNPAANTEILETVPAGAIWRLVSFHYQLVTDATVATRVSGLNIDDGANVSFMISAQSTHVASTTIDYSAFNCGAAGSASDNRYFVAIPGDLFLMPGWRIGTRTLNRQVGDDYAAPIYIVEEWMAP